MSLESIMIVVGSLLAIIVVERVEEFGQFLQNIGQPEPTPIDRLVERYKIGDISLAEYERQVELHLDPDAQQLRTELEAINGIGPDTSAAIAQKFDSPADLAAADQGELTAVHGVGSTTAAAVAERFG